MVECLRCLCDDVKTENQPADRGMRNSVRNFFVHSASVYKI